MANLLFIHQNYPAQFKHFAPALAAQGHTVSATVLRTPRKLAAAGESEPDGLEEQVWQGVRILPWLLKAQPAQGISPLLQDFETKVLRAQCLMQHLCNLRTQGLQPDVVLVHPGWGEGLFVKDVWPRARLVLYGEYFYQSQGGDVGFDPEFAQAQEAQTLASARLRMKNVNQWVHILEAETIITPTQWQASTYPSLIQPRITVLHEGVDTRLLQADAQLNIQLKGLKLQRNPEAQGRVVTFVNRNLEPYRGYHIFMRSLVPLLQQEPEVQVLIVGGSGTSYGALPPKGQTWQQIFAQEVREHLSAEQWQRVHFLGTLPYAQYRAVLAVSDVHVYLSYPFVLGWSMLEAMSMGCAIVGSQTAPVLEVMQEGEQGEIVDFFDAPGLARTVQALLHDPDKRRRYGQAARARVQAEFDLQSVTLPAQLAWMQRFLAQTGSG